MPAPQFFEDVEMIQHVPTAVNRSWYTGATIMPERGCGTASAVLPTVQFLDKVYVARCCTMTDAYGLTEQKTVLVPQLQCSDKGYDVLLCRSSSGSRGRCLKFSSSPEFVDLPVCYETVGFQRGFDGDVGLGSFRAPPVVPELSASFRSPL